MKIPTVPAPIRHQAAVCNLQTPCFSKVLIKKSFLQLAWIICVGLRETKDLGKVKSGNALNPGWLFANRTCVEILMLVWGKDPGPRWEPVVCMWMTSRHTPCLFLLAESPMCLTSWVRVLHGGARRSDGNWESCHPPPSRFQPAPLVFPHASRHYCHVTPRQIRHQGWRIFISYCVNGLQKYNKT